MSALSLLDRLRDLGIRVRAVDGELELDAPRGKLTDQLLADIRAHKRDLLRLLAWGRRSEVATTTPLVPASRAGPLPLSWAQQRLWFLDQLEPGSSAYNISWTVRLRGALDESALEHAWQALCERHETLRTVFPAVDGVPHQEIRPAAAPGVTRVAMRDSGDEALRARLQQYAAEPFDLAAGPLLRVTLLEVGPAEHILLVVIHHIIADGASMRILFRELAALYEARCAGAPAVLSELPVQYADYAVWQRSWLDGTELERQTDYWRTQLADLPPLLELPWDRPRAAAMRYRGAAVLRVLPADLAADLRRVSREHGCTLYMTMLAAFFVLLQRYSGRSDLVVGTPLGGRARTQLEGLIGFFINTVVLRADLDAAGSFPELLAQIRDTALEAHAHQDLPFEKLVEELQPQRELSYAPIFQVMFDLQEEPRWQLPVRGLEVIPEVVFSSRTSSFDLTLSVRQAERGLDAMFEYDTDLFDESSIERMAGHYRTLLEAIAAEPARPVQELPIVEPGRVRELVQGWHAAAADYPDESGLAQLVAANAAARPDAPALEAADACWSYAELDSYARSVAAALGESAQGSVVALLARRTPECLAALLGVLRAGATAVPLDPAYPAERLRFMLEDSGAAALVHAGADEHFLAKLGVAGLRCLALPVTPTEVAPTPALGAPDDAAFLMYTSGSTGRPKGVRLAHRGLVNYVCQLGRQTDVEADDRLLQFASLSFDIALEECFTAWVHGATLVLRDAVMTESLPDFVSGCEQRRISWASLPTAWWHELCAGMQRDEISAPASLRCLVIGGEKAELDALRTWRRSASGIRLLNTYGPTEGSIAVAWSELSYTDPQQLTEVPLGRPVPNTRVWVMDAQQRPLPVGLPGEICIGGIGLAQGYQQRAELTAERFPTVTLPDGSRERIYRTGDLGRYRADGELLFLGRSDAQIKLRGHRVEPGEVETVLATLPGVERCAVVAQGAGALARLVAYVTGAAEPEQLRELLLQRLPEYMVPASVVTLDALPFTSNGKLDRSALPQPLGEIATGTDFVAPRTPTEQQLVAIWSAVLGVSRIGVHDDFFGLGGHSLIATRVMARIREDLGAATPLRALFDFPTVAGLARQIERSGRASAQPLVPRTRAGELVVLSSAQRRLWMLDQLEPGNAAYNLYSTVQLRGPLQLERLQQALDGVVARHDILRTVFAEHGGEPVQRVAMQLRVPVQAEVCAAGDELRARILALIDEPFVLSAGPLLRVGWLRVANAGSAASAAEPESVLVFVLHHIVADGWSVNVLFRELAALYNAGGSVTALPELPVQYADYAHWQQALLAAAEQRATEAYWQTQLAGLAPLLELPADKPRPARQSFAGAWVSRTLPASLYAELQNFAQQQGATLFMVLLGAFKVVLLRHTGCSDLAVGTPVAGRSRTELEPLIGCFLNTLVVRTDLSAARTLRDAVAAARAAALDAFEHQDLPYERLLELLQPARSEAYTPLVQVLFNVQNQRGDGLRFDGLAAEPLLLERAAAKFDLSVSVLESADGLQCGFEYSTDLFVAATMERMLEHFEEVLAALVRTPSASIAALPLAGADAAPAVTAAPVFMPGDYSSVAARFFVVAREHAERPAVQTAGAELLYRELAAQVRATAQGLLEAGVLPGSRVGLVCGHDSAMVAGVLAALAAGAVYVPLDPRAPGSRQQELAELAQVSALLTSPDMVAAVRDTFAAALPICEVAVTPAPAQPTGPERPLPALRADALAYILFTSGSTGTPKGVLQTHKNLLHHAALYAQSLQLRPTDRLSLLSQFGFDAAVMDIFGAVLTGACLHPVDVRAAATPDAALAELMKLSVLHSTPTVWRYLLAARDPAAPPPHWRAVVLGGETALRRDFDLFRQHCAADAVFVNGYGPTESTLATQFFATRDTHWQGAEVPIGAPVPGVGVTVMRDGAEAVVGELVITSPYLSPGYLDDAELTAQRFVLSAAGARTYRTGDAGRCLPTGQLAHTGRLDGQLKLRGYRIEPAEIERTLGGFSGVERSAVVLHDEALVACFSGTADVVELRSYLRSRLPDYMVPARLQHVAELPLRANGKIDREALRSSVGVQPDNVVVIPPRNAAERTVAEVWRAVLDHETIGADADFFALGGHSLLATQVLARLRDLTGASLSLRDLFAAPTVAELARLLPDAAGQSPERLPLRRRSSGFEELPPLSWSQQRLWFLDQLEPDNAAYHLHWAARVRGALDPEALEQAVRGLVARHETLRTHFQEHGGEPVQIIAAHAELDLHCVQLPGAGDEALRTRLLQLVRRPFDLRAAPLLRAALIQLGPEDAVVLIVVHHIVADGWSMGVLVAELSELYAAQLDGHPPALAPLPLQYADFAVWQRRWLAGAELDRQTDYWTKQLRDAPPLLEMPLDFPRPPVQRYRGAWVTRQVGPALLTQLHELAGAHQATLFMVLLTAFKVLILRHTGRSDILVGTPTAGRSRTELEGLIGYFLNMLVLRTPLAADASFAQTLTEVRTTTIDAYDHQELPFERLLELCQPRRSTAHTPLVQLTFNLHNEPGGSFAVAGAATEVLLLDRGTTKFDLSVALVESRAGLQVGMEYNTDLFRSATVAEWLRQYEVLLNSAVADPGLPVGALELMPRRVPAVPDFVTKPARPGWRAGATLPECIAAVAAAHPERAAVRAGAGQLSYRQLDGLANALAQQVCAVAMPPQSAAPRAGLLLGHDAAMVVGVLGALKSGHAYVPLDPAAPPRRLAELVERSEVNVLIAAECHTELAREVAAQVATAAPQVVTVDMTRPVSAAPPESKLNGNDLAYVLFTSGSTGRPKGVLQSHTNVLHHAGVYIDALGIRSTDCLSLFSAYGFDAAVMDIFGALLSGACLCPLDLRGEAYAGAALDQLAALGVTLLHTTPTVFRYLMRSKVCRHELDRVRAVVLGGEEATATDFELFRRQFAPPTLFVNGLGPSESTLAAQFFADHDTSLPGGLVPVGTAVRDTELLLLDAAGQRTTLAGELAIRSRFVARGYLDEPELTAERFIADPDDPRYCIYRTGDRARRLPDGNFVFCGRTDEQIKLRGHRVEPAEIEAALCELDGVERAAVLLRPAEPGRPEQLVAYVVGAAVVSELRSELRKVLPEYMVPGAFVPLDALPLTQNGKLDRRALPAPSRERDALEGFVAPRTPTEQQLATLWQDILGVATVGVHDDFFELGGHSLLAAQLAGRIHESLQVVVPLRRLFDAPTIARLAEHVETLRWALEAADQA